MPPKAQATATRGRPKRTAAPAPEVPVANASKKRGRVAKAQDVDEAAETPKKRGRPAKMQVEEAVVVEAAPAPKKRMGRPPKSETAAEDAPAPKKRMGRPPKNATAPAHASAATSDPRPGRRGRASAAALDLSRVAGSPRVTKARPKAAPSKAMAPPRLNPRLRSKLRARQPPTPKIEQQPAPAPAKRRGPPPKVEPKPAQASAPKQVKSGKSTQKAAARPVAPRKKRGFTTLEIPDKYAAQMKQYLESLVEAHVEPTLAAEEEDAEPGAEVDAEDEEPVMIVEEEVVITSATSAADEEHVLALAEQLDGAESSADADDLNAAITSPVDIESDQEQPEVATAVEVELNIQEVAQAEQDAHNAVDEDMIDSADGFTSELNDKENAFDAYESRSLSDEVTDAYIGGAVPGASGSLLFGQGGLSL